MVSRNHDRAGRDAIAAQERARMVSPGMTDGGVRIGAAPGEDRCAIDDEIACANQAAMQGQEHSQHEETFKERSSCDTKAFALLRGAGNVWASLSIQG